MNGYNFTERTRKTLAVAREEAVRLDHEYVGTEHILLAVLADGGGVAEAVLDHLGADRAAIRANVEDVVKPGRRTSSLGPDLPYTTRGKKVLELAFAEAAELRHPYLGTEHLLLGLLREERGIAAQVLTHLGMTLPAARAEVVRLLGQPVEQRRPDHAPDVPAPAATATARAVAAREPDHVREHAAWIRLTRALDVCERLGAPASLTLEADGTVTVPFGPDLVVSVEFPPSVRLRRRDATPPGGGTAPSAQEPA